MFDVTAIGELLIDFAWLHSDSLGYPTMAAHPGGAPANFLATLQKLGKRTALISKVGDDVFGKMLIDTMKHMGTETSGIKTSSDVFTTLTFVTFDSSGNRDFFFSRKPGADTQLSSKDLDLGLLESCRVLHFGSLSLTADPAKSATYEAIRYAKKNNKLISYDPNFRKSLWDNLDIAKEQILWGLSQSDIVKISDEECKFLFGNISFELAAQKILKEYGVKLVYITLGKNGCVAATNRVFVNTSGFPELNTIDTTGAGDIFAGAAMCRVLSLEKDIEDLSSEDLLEIIRFACACASLSTTRPGGISSIPNEEEITALL